MKAAKLVVAFAMLYAVAAAAPAGAAEFAYCDPLAPAGAALYPDADGASRAALGRGGVVREPELGEVHSDLPASAKGRAAERFKATVPVYFHVVTDGATGSAHERADRDADRRAQQDLRRRRGRRRRPASASQLAGRDPHGQRRAGSTRTRAAPTSTR